MELDPLVQDERERLAHALDVAVQVRASLHLWALTAELEQLAGERGSLLGRGDDGLHVLEARIVLAQVCLEEVAGAADHAEDVVEVVGDTSGEAADGLHLLGLSELLVALAKLLFGDVLRGDIPEEAEQGACVLRGHAGRDGTVQLELAALGARGAQLDPGGLGTRLQPLCDTVQFRAIVLTEHVQERGRELLEAK